MPAWLMVAMPYFVQIGEAAVFGAGAAGAAHAAGADGHTAAWVGFWAALGKLAPSQVLPGGSKPVA